MAHKRDEFFDELFTVSAPVKAANEYISPCLTEDPLLELLLAHPQDFSTVKVHDSVQLSELIRTRILDKPVSYPNRALLGSEFTDEDYGLLCKKIELQHQQFQSSQVRDVEQKLEKFKSAFPHLTIEELFCDLEEHDFHEDETLLQLTKIEFIQEVRKKIAQLSSITKNSYSNAAEAAPSSEPVLSSENSDEESSEPEISVVTKIARTSISGQRKRTVNTSDRQTQRLKLDEALEQADSGMSGWSEARIRAYKLLDQNPNSYYYRFNAPGEQQRNGPWSPEEHEMFMKRLAEHGADGQWGIFSMTIPGRVGYQCSNYYRKLIEMGEITDPNYAIDAQGKVHFIGGRTRSKKVEDYDFEPENSVSISNSVLNQIIPIQETNVKNRPSREQKIVLYDYVAPSEPQFVSGEDFDNPLPGFVDAITRMPVTKPAISPYGHVLSYDTWMRCLLNSERKNTCPITNQPLHKRQLIFLTHDNIDEYRSQIIDLCAMDANK